MNRAYNFKEKQDRQLKVQWTKNNPFVSGAGKKCPW